MKLSKSDKAILQEAGYLIEDMKQIEKSTTKTKYMFVDGDIETKISLLDTMNLLGRKNYLISLGRSSFHRNTICEIEGTKSCVYFDSSKLFV